MNTTLPVRALTPDLCVAPQLQPEADAVLVLLDLGRGANRLGGSVLAQACGQTGASVRVVAPALLQGVTGVVVPAEFFDSNCKHCQDAGSSDLLPDGLREHRTFLQIRGRYRRSI